MTLRHQSVAIGIGGTIAAVIAYWLTGSMIVVGVVFILAGVAVIVMTSHAYMAAFRALEYKRKSAEFRAGPSRHFGLTHPMSKHDTAPDMTVDDFNRATRVAGQPIVKQPRDKFRIVRNDRDLT